MKYNKINSKKLWKIVNDIVSNKSTSSYKIFGVLDKSVIIISYLRRVTDIKNKNFVNNIADNLSNEIKDALNSNPELFFKEFTNTQIKMYIGNIRPSKSMQSDGNSI